jgi:hypothetical protein
MIENDKLRDTFAQYALAALIHLDACAKNAEEWHKSLASDAYDIADAMLSERMSRYAKD